MASSTFTATLAVGLGFGLVFPCWTAIVRYQCEPGATFADTDDSARYYRCIGDGSIRLFYCTEGSEYCGDDDQLCCGGPSESVDSTYEPGSAGSSNEGIHSHDSGQEEQSSRESRQEGSSAQLKSDEENKSYEFVGQRFEFTSRNEGSDEKVHDETLKSTEIHMHSDEKDEPRDEDEHEGTGTNADVDGNVSFEDDGGPLHPSVGSETNNHDASGKDASQYGVVNNSNEGDIKLDIHDESHSLPSDEMGVSHAAEFNGKVLKVSDSFEDTPEKEASRENADSEDFRRKRNADNTDSEGDSTTANMDNDEEKKKKDNRNHGSETEVTTLIDSSAEDTDVNDQSLSVDSADHGSHERKSVMNEDDAISSPESAEENLNPETTEIPLSDITVNPSLVAEVHGGASLDHAYSYMDNKTQQIVQIVKSILRLANEQPIPIHRELLSPENVNDGQNTMNFR